MSAAINDDELSISLPAYEQTRPRPSLPLISPPVRIDNHANVASSPGTVRAMNRLNQYAFVRNIGEGSFGKVKLMRHKSTGQEVAMKTINRRKLISRDMAGRIEREIQYLQLLRHPHIIKLYTVITTKTDICMVLEYVPEELFDYIVKHGRLQEPKARRLFQQIISAVEYCHRHKIVHRDLKPENLLLDSKSNVKIADFGLSNIMTDGNFLKTSCGSPNYAAPEVIGGKLYAGPEVDVWSCGVILFVFLAGRLPFDDEFIPTLFKKIQAGTFNFPPFMSGMTGAISLIKKCLQVHPVHRITIPEIRQDPWFLIDLPPYLSDPVAEVLDTGVDPNKAINPQSLAPGKSAEVVQAMHEKVVAKLGGTMGYNNEDVKEALSKEEPSAIKDAYLIVRENQMMVQTPGYQVAADNLESFLATSPPVDPVFPNIANNTPSRRYDSQQLKPLTSRTDSHRASRSLSEAPATREEEIPRISNVRVLNTSLPHVHADLLAAREKAKERREDPDSILHPSQVADVPPEDENKFPPLEETDADGKLRTRPVDAQNETRTALKPHSRSVVGLNEMRKNGPEPMTTTKADDKEQEKKKKVQPVKAKGKRWQFGIRSRNAPFEAMKCLFNALRLVGAEWQIIPTGKSHNDSNGEDRDRQDSPPPELAEGEHYTVLQERYQHLPSDYYIPQDPWHIRARILKKGLMMPGEAPALSAHSSAVSLPAEAQHQMKKHLEELGGYADQDVIKALGLNGGSKPTKVKSHTSSAQNTRPSSSFSDVPSGSEAFSGPPSALKRGDSGHSLPNKGPNQQIGVYVFIDIQLYQLESNTFMVDFKCDGYQNVVLVDPAKERTKSFQGYNSNGSPYSSPTTSRPQTAFGDDKQNGHDLHLNNSAGDDDETTKPYWKPTTRRFKNKEKEISSPYPYLDVASDLIAQLAG